jgi:hypothetical protein
VGTIKTNPIFFSYSALYCKCVELDIAFISLLEFTVCYLNKGVKKYLCNIDEQAFQGFGH